MPEQEPTRRWWQSWNVPAASAFIAAILPITTAIQGCNDKEKQLAIDASRARQELADKYLDRLSHVDERLRTLSFLAATAPDPEMRAWAAKELPEARQKFDELKARTDHLEAEHAETERKFNELMAQGCFAAEPADSAKPDNPALRSATAASPTATTRVSRDELKRLHNQLIEQDNALGSGYERQEAQTIRAR